MERVRLVRRVRIPSLEFVPPVITRDTVGRVTQMVYEYTSIRVTYTVNWQGEENVLVDYTRTVQDK